MPELILFIAGMCISCASRPFRATLRAWPHRLRLKRSVARLEIALCALRTLDIKQPLPFVVVRSMNERGKRALQEQPRMQTSGLNALHRDGLVQAQRRLGHERQSLREGARYCHQVVMRNDLVDHADTQRLLRIKMITCQTPAVRGL